MGMSATDKIMRERVENDYAWHAPTGDKAERQQMIRESGKAFAHAILACAPGGREQSLALTKLEEATFWASEAIVREG